MSTSLAMTLQSDLHPEA